MANSAAASPGHSNREAQDRTRADLPEQTRQGLWVQRSIQLGGQAKPVLRKSASVNNLWVKQSIAFVSRDV
ncbi:hypothetical protein AC1031_012039 [Aphanomyces cochlioides]|nr:hypothetical protein AC1031_012039 [Aphanomyces cochlioides]